MGRYAVIMAGGSGTRLWPMSRNHLPKQLLKLSPDGKSLLRKSVERLNRIFDYGDIFIIAARNHIEPISKEIPEIPRENLIGEPVGRDTANAVGLSVSVLYARDSDATVGIFTADHLIEPVDRFGEVVLAGYDAVEANPDYLGTFGIKPQFPHTGLGYIHRGELIKSGDVPIYRVKEFKEKPDRPTAERYIASGEYYWNSGMFVWKAKTILGELDKHLPENAGKLMELGEKYGGGNWDSLADRIYPELKKISIDFAVMEKARNVLVAEMDVSWADVGSWPELEKVVGKDNEGHSKLIKNFVSMGAKNCVVVNNSDEHLIALVGVEDLIVIHTDDATLVCPKDRSQDIKKLVQIVEKQFGKKYV